MMWWVYLVCAALGGGAVFWGFNWRLDAVRRKLYAEERERERDRIQAEAARQRDTFAHMNRVSALGELATSLAHELSQPISAISTSSDLALILLDRPSPDLAELRTMLSEIREDNERAAQVIRKMRVFLKQSAFLLTNLDLNEVVKSALSLVRNEALHRQVTIRVDLAEALPNVSGDDVQLQQVILNLIANGIEATEHTPQNRSIAIRTGLHRDGKSAFFEVKDSGPGVPELSMKRLFEPFFTTKPDGLGMGLAISRSIVEASHGSLQVEKTDSGALFRVLLPLG